MGWAHNAQRKNHQNFLCVFYRRGEDPFVRSRYYLFAFELKFNGLITEFFLQRNAIIPLKPFEKAKTQSNEIDISPCTNLNFRDQQCDGSNQSNVTPPHYRGQCSKTNNIVEAKLLIDETQTLHKSKSRPWILWFSIFCLLFADNRPSFNPNPLRDFPIFQILN